MLFSPELKPTSEGRIYHTAEGDFEDFFVQNMRFQLPACDGHPQDISEEAFHLQPLIPKVAFVSQQLGRWLRRFVKIRAPRVFLLLGQIPLYLLLPPGGFEDATWSRVFGASSNSPAKS